MVNLVASRLADFGGFLLQSSAQRDPIQVPDHRGFHAALGGGFERGEDALVSPLLMTRRALPIATREATDAVDAHAGRRSPLPNATTSRWGYWVSLKTGCH